MKRKPPKNLRHYATPSGRKARMVKLTERDLDDIRADDGLGAPFIQYNNGGDAYVKADELRKWRAGNPSTSGDANGTE